jgi:hypothetical protein
VDIRAGLERHMEKARRNGSSPEGAERAGILWLTLTVIKLKNKLAAKRANELAEQLPILAGKAVTTKDRLDVLGLQVDLFRITLEAVEQAALEPGGLNGKASGIEGKAIRDGAGTWSKEQRQAFIALIRAGGGGTADGKPFRGDPLAADNASFARAESVIRGEVESTVSERIALERFQCASPLTGAA